MPRRSSTTPKVARKPKDEKLAGIAALRHQFYKALVAMGAKLCAGCGDYVLPEIHVCDGQPLTMRIMSWEAAEAIATMARSLGMEFSRKPWEPVESGNTEPEPDGAEEAEDDEAA